MCGLCGAVTRNGDPERPRQLVRSMTARLQHRGPDGEGFLTDDQVALGFRRLAIIDPEGGDQPLFNEDKSLAALVNGEIYNEPELRPRLSGKGHRFRTGSDCEVVVHLYEEHGLDFLRYLRGMFAIALWDRGRRRLVLARDRMGEKPLYLVETDDGLYFCSELRAIVQSGVVKPALDSWSTHLYFHYQYVPEPRTPITGVSKLDAGEILVVDVRPWTLERRRYWSMTAIEPFAGRPSRGLREVIEDLGPKIVRSDVPIGVARSGGLDSAAVAAMAHRWSASACAFSVGYAGRPQSDERELARETARHFGMEFFDVELTPRNVVETFRTMNIARDDPIADISGSGYLAVMQLARSHGVPVILAGHGGDELFWGYGWVRSAMRQNRRRDRLRQWRSEVFGEYLVQDRPAPPWVGPRGRVFHALKGVSRGCRELWRDLSNRSRRPYLFEMDPNFIDASNSVRRIYQPGFAKQVTFCNEAHVMPWCEGLDPGVALTEQIAASYLRENGMSQCDRLSMAASVELRLPLVDYQVVESVVACRRSKPDDSLPPKERLIAALSDIVPREISGRRKRGFEPPVFEWHRALFEAYGDTLVDGFLVQTGVLQPEAAREYASGPSPPGISTPMSFKALVLELWCRDLENAASTMSVHDPMWEL